MHYVCTAHHAWTQELLSELEGLRDWVSRDVAWAAMQSVREARSLDAFISALQAEVSELGSEIGDEIAEVEGEKKKLRERKNRFAAKLDDQ